MARNEEQLVYERAAEEVARADRRLSITGAGVSALHA
jgi:hypothetical protein